MAYFTVSELRSFKPELSDAAQYPDAAITAAGALVEAMIERVAHRSFEPRSKTVTVNGEGEVCLFVPDLDVTAITAVTVTGQGESTEFGAPELADLAVEVGVVTRRFLGTFARGTQNVTVEYVHGEAVVPAPIKRAAMIETAARLIRSDISDRATSITDDTGTVTLGGSWPFFSPESKALVDDWTQRPVRIA